MKSFTYSSETMQRKLEQAKTYLRERGKYVLDEGCTFKPSHTVRWDEYKQLVRQEAQRAN
jgi:hypothetical protein